MATTAPDPTRAAAPGWLDPFLADWRAGHRRAARDPRARDRPALADAHPVDARRRRAGRRRGRRRPAGLGRRRATRSGRAILRRAAEIYEAHRAGVRDVDPARDRRRPQQDAPRAELRGRRVLNAAATMPFQPYGQLVPSVVPGRLSMLRRVPGRRHRRDHAVELADRARDARRRAGAGRSATPSSSSPTRRRRSAAARCSRPSSARRACPRACSRSSSAAPTSARRS